MGRKKVYDFNNIVVESFNMQSVGEKMPAKKLSFLPGIFFFYIFVNSPIVFFFGAISLIIFTIIKRSNAARIDLIRKYFSVMRQKRSWNVAEIALEVGVSEAQARRDLTSFFDEGIIELAPESYAYEYDAGFVKPDKMVDDENFSFSVEPDVPNTKRGRSSKKKEDDGSIQRPPKGTENEELFNKVFDYIKRIKKANDRIPDEQFTAEIDEIEKIATQIYQGAMSHPEVMSDMRKFVNYYLPTTLKLLESYADLNEKTIVTPSMSSTMENIRLALKDIKEAFYKMYENIFSYTSIDISTEIGALENVLMSEGLLRDGLTLNTDELEAETEEEETFVDGGKG